MSVQKRLQRRAAVRRRRALVALTLVLLLVGGAAYFLTRDGGTGAGSGSADDRAAERESDEPDVLQEAPGIFYLEDNVLKTVAPGQEKGEVVRDGVNLGSTGPDDGSFATWVAFLTPVEPRLHIYERSAEELTARRGTSPLWNASGSRLAYKRPFILGTPCDEERCKGDEQVFVFQSESGKTRGVLEPGRWDIVAWADETLVVGDRKRPEGVLLVDPDGEQQRIEVPYEGIKSVSPNGKWMLFGPESGPELLRIDDGIEAWSLGGDDDTITNVAWSSDSSRAAVVAATGALPSRLFIVDTSAASPTLEPFNEDEVTGDVYWTEDDRGIVMTQVNREVPQFEASYCPIDAPNSCVSLLEWTSSTRLFAINEDD